MTIDKSGGPAFPVTGQLIGGSSQIAQCRGMSMLQYYACKALTGRIMAQIKNDTPELIAKYCFDIAEAMRMESLTRL